MNLLTYIRTLDTILIFKWKNCNYIKRSKKNNIQAQAVKQINSLKKMFIIQRIKERGKEQID